MANLADLLKAAMIETPLDSRIKRESVAKDGQVFDLYIVTFRVFDYAFTSRSAAEKALSYGMRDFDGLIPYRFAAN